MALIIVSCKMTPAGSAAEKDMTHNSVLKFYAGIAVAFSIHEGAHGLVAELTDAH